MDKFLVFLLVTQLDMYVCKMSTRCRDNGDSYVKHFYKAKHGIALYWVVMDQ